MHGGYAVLIVANDLSRGDALVDPLSFFDAELEVVIGGSAGTSVAKTELPDAALIDTGLSDIGCWRVTETLRI
jgi:DNA-binding response OmpR family regulator